MKLNLRPKQSGSSLVVVIITLATLMVIVGVAAEYTTNINRNVQRSNSLETAIAVGDSCIDMLFANWRTICRGSATTALATSAFQSIALPTAANFPTLPNLPNFGATAADFYSARTANPPTISNFKIVAANAEWIPLTSSPSSTATPIPALGQIGGALTTSSSLPTTTATFNYVATADVTIPTLKGNVVAKVQRIFQKQQLSPWNFAIFYVDPLEIHPGPLFTVTGWVHTNSDLYTGHDTLTFADKVTYGSDWSVGFMPGDGQHPETPQSPNYVNNLPPARDQALQPFGMDSNQIFNHGDSSSNNDDSYRELVEPSTGATDPLQGQRYWDQAAANSATGKSGVVIQVSDNPSANTKGFDNVKGDDLVTIGTANPSGGVTALSTSDPLYLMFKDAITTNEAIQDNREGNPSIRVATLDVSKIVSTVSSGNPSYDSSNFNGILYINDASATTHPLNSDGTVNLNANLNANGTTNANTVKRGIRIKNGSKIPASGLTIASNNPVYIQGDFNSGRGYDSNGNGTPDNGVNPPSNISSNLNADGTYINPSSPPAPQVSAYTRAPCSVLADAINILSNSWDDSKAGTVPNASPTTVNTAIVSGIVPTAPAGGDGSYSGGAENFPRFLENWTNKTLTYYGSMVELYKSQQSTGEWGKDNVYAPPTREWLFDTNFKTNPPPGTIMVYSYIKGRWKLL
jgi:hypothetical protein